MNAQTIPEMIFQNPVLINGTAGADGAQYLFSNVGPNMDAVVEITGRSAVDVVLTCIDTVEATGTMGFKKAFQPVLGIPGTAPAYANWWMKFKVTFYNAGTSTKVKLATFNVTGLDIDGDGLDLAEWAEMDKISQIDTAAANSLTLTFLNENGGEKDYKIEGTTANAPGIDTAANNVMATYTYLNKDNFEFYIGAKTNSIGSSAAMRFNSIWFKQFSQAQLPVKMISFSTMLINEKAVLNWRTVAESNLSHFVIEKSSDGIKYADQAIVLATGNETAITDYSFTDNHTSKDEGLIYYRIRSVDIDSKSKYSEVRVIRINKEQTNTITINTYPNPVTDDLRISIPSDWQNKNVSYYIYNGNGEPAIKINRTSSSQTESMNMSGFAPGIYFVKVICEGQVAQQKIIKH